MLINNKRIINSLFYWLIHSAYLYFKSMVFVIIFILYIRVCPNNSCKNMLSVNELGNFYNEKIIIENDGRIRC